MTFATVGRCNSQFSAICGTVLPVSFATVVQRVDHRIDILVRHLRTLVDAQLRAQTRGLGQRLTATDLAGQVGPSPAGSRRWR